MKKHNDCIEYNGICMAIYDFNYLQLLDILKEKRKEYSTLFDATKKLLKEHKIERLKEIYTDIKTLEYHLRKNAHYKKIQVNYDGDIDQTIIELCFPKNTKRTFLKKWLIENDLYINENYPCFSDYDCSGQLIEERTTIRRNKIIITKYYDL